MQVESEEAVCPLPSLVLACAYLPEMMMDLSKMTPHAGILSRSPMHDYITGPVNAPPVVKSSFSPYRKRLSLLSLVSLERAEEALQARIEEQGEPVHTQQITSSASSLTPIIMPG